MKKLINGETKQVYEVVVELSVGRSAKEERENLPEVIETQLNERSVSNYELVFSPYRIEINLYDRSDYFTTISMLDSMMNKEDSFIKEIKTVISTY